MRQGRQLIVRLDRIEYLSGGAPAERFYGKNRRTSAFSDARSSLSPKFDGRCGVHQLDSLPYGRHSS